MGCGSNTFGSPPLTTIGTPAIAPEAMVTYTFANNAFAAPLEACPTTKPASSFEYMPSACSSNSMICAYTSGTDARGWLIASPSEIDFRKIGTGP